MIPRVCGFIVLAALSALAGGNHAEVSFSVSDDLGAPITNVVIEGCFLDTSASGHGEQFRGRTDVRGRFKAQGATENGVYGDFSAPGHYDTRVREMVSRRPSAGGAGIGTSGSRVLEIPVVMKRVRNPIPLLAQAIDFPALRAKHGEKSGRYVTNFLVGYDCVRGVEMPPVGEGEVGDLSLIWLMAIRRTDAGGLVSDYDTRFETRFANSLDGIQRGQPDGTESPPSGSELISAYRAPLDGYTNSIVIDRRVRGDRAESTDDHHYLYYFRIRTQTNEAGQVTNALYGKIYGQLNGTFRYYLNPTPNDRNVEFDPKRNLFSERKASLPVLQP